jgi:hypothetical protein
VKKTYGERIVQSGVNPSESDTVKEIKSLAAQLIDKCREISTKHAMATLNPATSEVVETANAVMRHTSMAITHIETGAMFAVKAATA